MNGIKSMMRRNFREEKRKETIQGQLKDYELMKLFGARVKWISTEQEERLRFKLESKRKII